MSPDLIDSYSEMNMINFKSLGFSSKKYQSVSNDFSAGDDMLNLLSGNFPLGTAAHTAGPNKVLNSDTTKKSAVIDFLSGVFDKPTSNLLNFLKSRSGSY